MILLKKIYLSILGLICIIWIVCTGFLKVTLTVQDVKRLSKREYNLTWSDFEKYQGSDIGFGLYIKSYPIKDFNGYLLVAGGSPEEEIPLYIKIKKSINPYVSTSITSKDIRCNDITYFFEID